MIHFIFLQQPVEHAAFGDMRHPKFVRILNDKAIALFGGGEIAVTVFQKKGSADDLSR